MGFMLYNKVLSAKKPSKPFISPLVFYNLHGEIRDNHA